MKVPTRLPRRLSPEALEEWQAHALRVQPVASAERLWKRVLTEEDRQGLGGDFQVAYGRHGTVGMWQEVRGVSAARAVVDVAHALGLLDRRTRRWLLQELGEIDANAKKTLQAAIASGALILVEQPRWAYWKGRKMPIDWQRRSALWEFFWELCRKAKARKPLDRLHFGNRARANIVTQQKSRLVNLRRFPADLAALIQPVGRGTQKLNLPTEQIRLFERSGRGGLREWTP
jgi:hypothetical protein